MDQLPGPSSADPVKPLTSTPTTKKTTRKSLKNLLESTKPVFSVAQKCASAPLTFEEIRKTEQSKVSKNNEYVLHPVGPYTFFFEEELQEYYEDFQSSATDRIFISKPDDLGNMNFKF